MIRPKVKRLRKDCYEIGIIGNRDPRGWDNHIKIEVTSDDELVITVPKVLRCYSFNRVEENSNEIKIIAK